MPITTRSQSGREGDGSQNASRNASNPTTSAESSATGSGTTATSGDTTTATTTTSGTTATQQTTQKTTLKPPSKPPSRAPSRPPSVASSRAPSKDPSRLSSTSRKKLLAELEAKERVAELEAKQLHVATRLARLRLQKMQAMESSEEEEENEENEESSVRVEEWLKNQEKERRAASPPPYVQKEASRMDGRGQGDHRSGHQGKEEPRPARQDITELAEAITQAMRTVTREAPRYIQELPIFNGQSNAWLPFKAAYEDTSRGFSDTENIARLRRSLRGVALEAVQSLLLSNPEPSVIIATLERRFGRPEAIVMGEMEKIRTLQKVGDNPRDLLVFANKIVNIVATVEALKKVHYLYNPEMARIVVEKLSPILRSKWYDFAARNKEDVPELKRLATFLNEEADKCGAYASLEAITEEKFKKKQERTFNVNTLRCPACNGPHHLHDCKKFLAASTDERWEIAKKSRVCFRCLRNNHRHSDCRAKACGHQGCTMSHHKLLHQSRPKSGEPLRNEEPPRRDQEPPRRDQEPPHREKVGSTYEDTNNSTSNGTARRAYLKIVPVVLTAANGNEKETFALLDEGSTITVIDEKITQELRVDGPIDPMNVRGVSGKELQYPKSKRVDLKIRGKFADETFELRNARTVRGLDFATQRVCRRDIEDCPHLNQIQDELVYGEAHPKLLIGQDNWDLIISGAVRAGRKDRPVASYTRLGWVLHGCRSAMAYPETFCGHLIVVRNSEESVERTTNYFKLKSVGVEKRTEKSGPEQRALKTSEETSRRLPDGRSETRSTVQQFAVDPRVATVAIGGREIEKTREIPRVEKTDCIDLKSNIRNTDQTKKKVPKTEERKTGHNTYQRPDHAHLPQVERFSSFTRLLRATARVLQFVDLCRRKKNETVLNTKRKRTRENKKNDSDKNTDKTTRENETSYEKKRDGNIIGIEAHYLIRAEKLWWKAVQEDCFSEDLRRVRSGAAPQPGDRLSALSVVVGEDGVLRLRGRIHASPDIDIETASPAVLDGKHLFTRLYIHHVHERLHHGGIETVVNETRKRTWILKTRPTVRDVIKHCQRCKLRRAKPASPTTGNLPLARASHHARRRGERSKPSPADTHGGDAALTPNHILLGPNSHVPPPGEFTADDLTARKHWRRAQRLADVFWSRWVKEYQPLLQHRREPRTTGAPPAVGDLVLICDPNLPRNTWPRGRIVAVYPGRDGEVRIVDVETSNGHVLRRPTKRIVVLPVGSQSCDGGRNVHDDT